MHADDDMRPLQRWVGPCLSDGAAGLALVPCGTARALAVARCAAAAAVRVEVRVLPHMRGGSHNTAEQSQQKCPCIREMG